MLAAITPLEIPPLLREITAVIAVIVDEQGYVQDANRGFMAFTERNQLPQELWNVRTLFVQPAFSEFISTLSDQPGKPVYQGIINIGNPDISCTSVNGSVYRERDKLLIVAEYDIADLERLSATVTELNDEMAQMQRDLVKANRELTRNEKKITELMLSDPLTGIANRRHFDQRLQDEIEGHARYKHPLCLVMGDIDHFKRVNDNYGHDVGDIVICRFAHALRDNKRSTDFVARVGGEEFMLLLPQTSTEQGYLVIDRIRDLFVEESYEGIDHPITASFGLACLQQDDSAESFIKRVDQGLYKAKETGRNKVVTQL